MVRLHTGPGGRCLSRSSGTGKNHEQMPPADPSPLKSILLSLPPPQASSPCPALPCPACVVLSSPGGAILELLTAQPLQPQA